MAFAGLCLGFLGASESKRWAFSYFDLWIYLIEKAQLVLGAAITRSCSFYLQVLGYLLRFVCFNLKNTSSSQKMQVRNEEGKVKMCCDESCADQLSSMSSVNSDVSLVTSLAFQGHHFISRPSGSSSPKSESFSAVNPSPEEDATKKVNILNSLSHLSYDMICCRDKNCTP